MKLRRFPVVVALAAVTSIGSAQVVLTGRDSQVNFSYLYGYGPDVFTGGGSDSDGNLLAADGIGLQDSEEGQGEYLGHMWAATLSWNIEHSFAIDGALSSATKIASSGSTALSSLADGCSSSINSVNPGNQLTLEFVVATEQTFHISGEINQMGPLNRDISSVIIYKHDGFMFMPVWAATTPNTTFDDVQTFESGVYRVVSAAGSYADQIEIAGASWTYEIEAVPEPASVFIAVPVIGMMLRRRKRDTQAI